MTTQVSTTSEAVLDLNQDWTTHGVKSLSLYFYGDADNSGGQLFVRINNTEIAYDGAGRQHHPSGLAVVEH